MAQPSVVINELDGALGVLPSGQRYLAVIGTSDAGTADLPAAYSRTTGALSDYGTGPLTEEAGYAIRTTGRPVILVKAATAAAGSVSAPTFVGTGDTPTIDVANDEPNYDYEFWFQITKGGQYGTAGIEFQWSLDGGRTKSAVTALGTAASFVFPGSGGMAIDFDTVTPDDAVVGDTLTFRGFAPAFDSAGLTAALTALKNSALAWDIVQIAGPIDATLFDAIETVMAGMPEKAWIGSVRYADLAESAATYDSAQSAAFATKATVKGALAAGGCLITSGVSSRKYRARPSMAVGPLLSTVEEHIDVADVNLGSLPGVALRDVNGNLVTGLHDESVNPGLDDARFLTLRTWEDIGGVYVNNPRILSAVGSDFKYMQHRRLINTAKRALRVYFTRRTSVPVLVNATSGFILASEAAAIDAGANAILAAALTSLGKVSAASFTLNRMDNILSTETLAGQAAITPLGYPKTFTIDIGFVNPALQVETV